MQNKFCGTLTGFAIGDALGGPLEFMSANQIQIKHGVVQSMIGGGWQDLRPGQGTDDTALMCATAESLIEHKAIKPDALVQQYLRWYRTNPRDIAPTTREVFAAVEKGLSIEAASQKQIQDRPGQQEDNDFLSRCLPLSLLYFADPSKLMINTMKLAQMTHAEPKIASGAVALNLLISRILQGESDKKTILSQVMQLLDDNEAGVYNVLPDVMSKKKEMLRVGQRMQDTLETSIWGWYKAKNFKDGLITVINLGGDADTIGAISAAILGAYYGEDQIPQEWLAELEDKNIISGLGRKLYKIAVELAK